MKKTKLKSKILIPKLADWCPSSCVAVRRVYEFHKECPNFLTTTNEQISQSWKTWRMLSNKELKCCFQFNWTKHYPTKGSKQRNDVVWKF